jgi:hypothetical protein
MKYSYPEGTKVYLCEHEERNKRENENHVSFLSVYAGETVRFEMCRLCSTMALGVITGARIKEEYRHLIANHALYRHLDVEDDNQ